MAAVSMRIQDMRSKVPLVQVVEQMRSHGTKVRPKLYDHGEIHRARTGSQRQVWSLGKLLRVKGRNPEIYVSWYDAFWEVYAMAFGVAQMGVSRELWETREMPDWRERERESYAHWVEERGLAS